MHLGPEFLERKQLHDRSKYEDPEYTPYVYITWSYKCKSDDVDFTIPQSIQDKMNDATNHHINNNKHHPEYWSSEYYTVNPDDRDSVPDNIVDAKTMDIISIAEMVCDWHAVSLERGNSAKEWADANINKRWLFTDKQVAIIYKYIEDLKDQNIFKTFKQFSQ